MEHLNISQYIRFCLVKKDYTIRQLAAYTDQTPQNIQNKLTRNTFKVSELEKIADALDATLEIKFIDKETGKALI